MGVMKSGLGFLGFTLSAILLSGPAAAQSYPVKPIRIVAPYPPGSTIDTNARLLGNRMSENLGQPMVIDNRVGAGGVIGATNVARSPNDGYSILFTTPSTHVVAVFLQRDLPYDAMKDFTPITAAIESYHSLAVSMTGPVASLQELLQYGKQYPDKLSYGTAGIGTVFHLLGETFKNGTGVQILHVPYKGAPQALTDLVAGQIQMNFSTVFAHLQLSRAGKLRIIAIMNPERYPGLPSVPAIGEIVPGFDRPSDWQGFFGPAAVPGPVVQRLSSAIKFALEHPEVARALDETGQRSIWGSPEEFTALIKRGLAATAKTVKAAGLKPE
jgi:tripartite-type tricarboxylate transporter receptor subunit TctC